MIKPKLIYRYTRAQAIKDRELFDLSKRADREKLVAPIAITAALEKKYGSPEFYTALIKEVLIECLLRQVQPTKEHTWIQTSCWTDFHGRTFSVRLKVWIGCGDDGETVITVMEPEER